MVSADARLISLAISDNWLLLHAKITYRNPKNSQFVVYVNKGIYSLKWDDRKIKNAMK
jgi:hypothetical protein